MKLIKEYLCDNETPCDDEIAECIKIVNEENCYINLKWFSRNGWCNRIIDSDDTFENVKEILHKRYSV